MSTYLNAAAVESWAEVDRLFDAQLRNVMRDGQGGEQVDVWVAQMFSNAQDMASEEDAPEAKRPRRIGAVAA